MGDRGRDPDNGPMGRPFGAIALVFVALSAGAACSGTSGTCTSTRDCQNGETCVGGTCQSLQDPSKKCISDDQCSATEFCDANGRCRAQGSGDGSSSDATAGVDAKINADATTGDATTPRPDGASGDAASFDAIPGSDALLSDTGPVDASLGDASPLDATPGADALLSDAGLPDSGTGCNLDADCMSPDRICVSNVCVLRCDRPAAAACGANQVCDPGSGRCVAGNLPFGTSCGIDAQCQSRLCLSLTLGGASHSICSQVCGAASECPLDSSCTYVSGTSFCLVESIFNPPATFDVRSGGPCVSGDIRCQSGWCNTQVSQCIETCSREADCASFGGSCWTYTQAGASGNTYDHLCLQEAGSPVANACVQSSECASGICDRYTGTCVAHCCADADCPTGQSCTLYDLDTAAGYLTKVCEPRTPGGTSQVLGAPCTQASDCESEVCAPANVTDPNAPFQCSTFCCNNADCAQFPNGRCEIFGGPTVGTEQTIVGVCVSG